MFDSRKRSVAKGLSWRIVAITVLTAVSWFITRNLKAVSLIVVAYHVLQVFIYFFHERVWSKIRCGRSGGLFIQMTGMSGAGKSTLAFAVKKRLEKKGAHVEVIDGDEYRKNLCAGLGFSAKDRKTNIRRLGFVGNVLARNNVICIMSAINPYRKVRKELGGKIVYIDCDLDSLKERDPKGLYKKALLPSDHPDHIPNFTGISDPYEEPFNADLILETNKMSKKQCVSLLEKFILENIEK